MQTIRCSSSWMYALKNMHTSQPFRRHLFSKSSEDTIRRAQSQLQEHCVDQQHRMMNTQDSAEHPAFSLGSISPFYNASKANGDSDWEGVLNTSQKPEPGEDISDHEWEIRTGRAIYVLQQTLPEFFTTGLVTSVPIPYVPRPNSLPNFTSSPLSPSTWLKEMAGAALGGNGTPSNNGEEEESIYSPRMRLEYTPPKSLPTPFPRTLHIEGLHLYIASSIFTRHTLNALYTDLRVELRNVRVHGPPSSISKQTHPVAAHEQHKSKTRWVREKRFVMGLGVTGIGRVSGKPAIWEVIGTYTFSPLTGLIISHTVDSIEPAPHQALFEALGRFGLFSSGGGGASVNGEGKPGVGM